MGRFFLVIALVAFGISNFFREESGLVAVTVLGIALANQKKVSVEHVLEFKENLTSAADRLLVHSCWDRD